uniref:Uncharacterized protein n=1 Tax=Eubacterium cellulosolvens (strain ATCC 43171 / JCM 9499 / 6) TaxID=633697 RepID=I5ASQ0_EUBC6
MIRTKKEDSLTRIWGVNLLFYGIVLTLSLTLRGGGRVMQREHLEAEDERASIVRVRETCLNALCTSPEGHWDKVHEFWRSTRNKRRSAEDESDV